MGRYHIEHMALSIKTNRMLWGRAASRCSLPVCRMELVVDPLETDDASLVGEAAHIVAEQPDGPRGESELTLEQRNKYANLILLCNVHHKQVDDQINSFTVDRLLSIKEEHEAWVKSSLSGFDGQRQADDERWAGYIDEWQSRADLDNWLAVTSYLMGATPAVDKLFLQRLDELRIWLLSRVWPESGAALRAALENFRLVVNDLVCRFREHADDRDRGELVYTEKFYKLREWDSETYDRLLRQFEFHVDLIHDLTFEMTRAANYVCDKVRESLDRSFRVKDGVLLVSRASGMTFYTYRPEYSREERGPNPYLGLEEFMDVRSSRGIVIGEGRPPWR